MTRQFQISSDSTVYYTNGYDSLGDSILGNVHYTTYAYGNESYQVDATYTYEIALPYSFLPTHRYDVVVAFSDIANIAEYNSAQASVQTVGIDSYVLLGGRRYDMGEAWQVHFSDTSISGNVLGVVVKTSYLCRSFHANSGSFTYQSFLLGYSTSNISVTVNDLGLYDSVGQQGNNIAQSGNDIAQKGNELQEESNETSKGILNKISDFFGSFFENIINALKSLFVPEDGYFSDFFERLNGFFSDKLGMLYAPIELFVDVLSSIQNASSVSSGIRFPGIMWDDVYLIEPQTINLQMYANEFPDLQQKLYFVTDIIMVGSVLGLLQSKFKEVMRS